MKPDRRLAVAALTAAGLLWGTTVPLSKLALDWLPAVWLTFGRFGVAAAVLLVAARSRVRQACTPAVLAWGAAGYGGSVALQNAGIMRTSVSHAALLVGATPVLVAVIAALWQHSVARPLAWGGFAVSLAGVGLVAGGRGGTATFGGDGLVLASLLLSAAFTVAQTRLLQDRDPVAVTAVQFLAAALVALPAAVATEGLPPPPGGSGALLAVAGLAIGGTLAPFTLFAYGQARVPAEVAGAFVNLEPLIGAAAGVVIFGDPAGPRQIAGGAAIIAGVALSCLLLLGKLQTPADHLGRVQADDGPGWLARRTVRVRQRLGPSADHDASRAPGRQDIIDRECDIRIALHVAELAGPGEVPAADIDRVQVRVVAPAQRDNVRQAGRIDGGEPAELAFGQVRQFRVGEYAHLAPACVGYRGSSESAVRSGLRRTACRTVPPPRRRPAHRSHE